MTQKLKVATLVGSLRRSSHTRRLAQALIGLQPESLDCFLVEVGDLPFYNQDLETDAPPKAWSDFRAAIAGSAGVLFVTPEYNRSVPATLKNAVDVGSRPWGKSVWAGRPAAIVSCSPGAMGGFGANHHLRQSLTGVGVNTMAAPDVYLAGVDKVVGPDGTITNPGTREFLEKFMNAFAAWMKANPKT